MAFKTSFLVVFFTNEVNSPIIKNVLYTAPIQNGFGLIFKEKSIYFSTYSNEICSEKLHK